jgi:hypothetical protein
MSSLASAMAIFAPSVDDYIVTIATRDGRVRNRRVSPGSISEAKALHCAMLAEKVHAVDIADASIRRIGSSPALETVSRDDPFMALCERLKLK